MSELLAHFQSLGDNCEFGIAQRRCGINESGIFRFARTMDIHDLIRLLDARFKGLFAEGRLQPRDYVMVEDQQFRIQFHTQATSVLQQDASWHCELPAAEQASIFERERARAVHCAAKTLRHLEAGTRLFVYKCNDTPPMADVAALLACLRRLGDNTLLFVRRGDDPANHGAVARVAPNLYEGQLNTFADYGRVATDVCVDSWRRLCEATWQLHARCDPASADRIRRSHRPPEDPDAEAPPPDVLDPRFYGRFYKDLGTLDEAALAKHWHLHGQAEERLPNFAAFIADRASKGVVPPPGFSPDEYRRLNPDLRGICEQDWECIAHYLDIGAIERRPYRPGDAARPRPLIRAEPAAPPADVAPPPPAAARAAESSVWQAGDVQAIGLLAGARLRTVGGPVPVEALVDGELLVTASGAVMPIVWVGKERYDASQHPRRESIAPVRLLKDSLGAGLPAADLLLAPDQPVLIDDVLVPAYALVNGATILSEPPPALFACFHVELAVQTLLVAEGVAVGSYPPSAATAPGRPAIRFGAERTQALSARLVTAGPVLARVKAGLLERAASLGHELSTEPDLRLATGQTVLRPESAQGAERRFTLPPGVTRMRLLSRATVGRWVWADSTDRRRLGIAVSRVRLSNDGRTRELPLEDLGGDGFHPVEQDAQTRWRWTDGAATLTCPPTGEAAVLSVTLHQTAVFWQRRDEQAGSSITAAGGSSRRIVFISGEPDTPGHVYRVLRPLMAARGLGLQADWVSIDQVGERLDLIAAAEVVVIWRAPVGPALFPAIEAARSAGAYLLFDVDDLMVDPALARREVIDAIRLNGYDEANVRDLYERTRQAVIACDGCLTTTEELALHMRDMNRPVWVLPNGFDEDTLSRARLAVRRRRLAEPDGLIRIGYAGGSRTHQRDLLPVTEALGRLLREHPDLRFVLFRKPEAGLNLVEIDEFPALAGLAGQIEWRDMVPLAALPDELARFDISIAPLEAGNLFCEAKSELKFFEAALVEVATVATPTGPFRRAIRDTETGFLATTADEWYAALQRLITDAPLRAGMARAAYHDCLRRFGPEQRADRLAAILSQLRTGRDAARAFELETRRAMGSSHKPIVVPAGEVLHLRDRLEQAEVTVVIPVYNYAAYVTEALDSVWHQTLGVVDLVVVDDRSTDDSVAVVQRWIEGQRERFNRIVFIRNATNSGLAFTRNAGFAAAETRFVLPLDADNRLFPRCLSACLQAIRAHPGAAFAYPRIQQFGMTTELMGVEPYAAMRLAAGNYIDAMALIDKSAWAAVGGYDHIRFGWEDFDLWCLMAEQGLWGCQAEGVLAEYRVHGNSMLRTMTDIARNKQMLIDEVQARHPWLAVSGLHALAAEKKAVMAQLDARPAAAAPPVPRERSAAPPRAAKRARKRLNGAAFKSAVAGPTEPAL
jgi:glycosyltransferase involved in cell wall biosynthesis